MQRLLGIFVLFTIPFLALACSGDSDNGDDATTGPTAAATEDAVAPEDMLNSLEDVRAVIVSAATDLDPAIVEDVDYSDGTLTVMLAEGREVSDADSMTSTCEDISSAVALPDLSVRLQSPDGEIVAECSFSS